MSLHFNSFFPFSVVCNNLAETKQKMFYGDVFQFLFVKRKGIPARSVFL